MTGGRVQQRIGDRIDALGATDRLKSAYGVRGTTTTAEITARLAARVDALETLVTQQCDQIDDLRSRVRGLSESSFSEAVGRGASAMSDCIPGVEYDDLRNGCIVRLDALDERIARLERLVNVVAHLSATSAGAGGSSASESAHRRCLKGLP